MPDLGRAVIISIIVFAVLYAGVASLSGVAEIGENTGSGVQRTGELVKLDGTGQYTQISDSLGNQQTVYNSLGFAVNLTGANDSYVSTTSPIDVSTDDTWTVSIGARADPSVTVDTMTAVSINGRLIIDYNATAGNWTAWYYDEGDRSSYRINVSAPNQPGNFTVVQVRSNGSVLAIYQNNTLGETANITKSSIASAPVNSTNWNGRLDELRTFDDALTDAERQALVDDPVDPLKGTNRTSRVMFDEKNAPRQQVFFTSTTLEQSNVSFSAGYTGRVMDGQTLINQITGTTDYVWDEEGPQIYVVSGGELDGAPAAYVDYVYYNFGGAQRDFVDGLTRAIGLGALIPTILILVVAVAYLLLLRN